jgi:hypothetical protein
MITVFVHLTNDEPIVAEMEKMPEPTDTCLVCMNPRKRDGKEVHYVLSEVTTVIFPWHRISFLEVMPTQEDEEVVSFVRE